MRHLRALFGLRLNMLPQRAIALRTWYLASALLILLAPVHWFYGVSLTGLSSELQIQAWVWALAFLAQATSLWIAQAGQGGARLWTAPLHGAVPFALGFLALDRLFGVPASSAVLLAAAGSAQVLVVLPAALGRATLLGSGVLVGGVAWLSALGRQPEEARADRVIATAFHSLSVREYDSLAGVAAMPGGALAARGNGFILVTGPGEFYQLEWSPDSVLTSRRLPLSADLNLDRYRTDLEGMVSTLGGGFFLRTQDIAIDEAPEPDRLYLVHQYWHADEACFTERVSVADVPAPDAGDTVGDPWSILFESEPCVPPSYEVRRGGTGARLAWADSVTLLLSIGDYGSAPPGEAERAQDPASSYGKVLRLKTTGGDATMVSMGHRNPQGLSVGPDGRVWSTEHGPQGGDEVNRIVEGANYGWPFATYGRQYGQDSWPQTEGRLDHAGFTEPALAFVPSIGISNLIHLGDAGFPDWEGDILVSSLQSQELIRLRTRDDRIVYAERFDIGHRVRDLEQGRDGRILIWTDFGATILTVSANPEPLAGERAYSVCAACHGTSLEGTPLGPTLRGVVGRDVAADDSFDYSPALRELGGTWTQARLEFFLTDPLGYAPGTRMNAPAVPDSLLYPLLEYIRTFEP